MASLKPIGFSDEIGIFELAKNGELTKDHLKEFDLRKIEKCDHTLLFHATRGDNTGNVCRAILQIDPRSMWIKSDSNTALHSAALNNNLNTARQLLETKWVIDRNGNDELYNCQYRFFGMVRYLLSTKRLRNNGLVDAVKFMIYFHDRKEETTQAIFPLTLLCL